jgi:GH43 family beta-xylosidase
MSNVPIADVDMPDPWMIVHNNYFYLLFTLGNRIEIWRSSSMENFSGAQKVVVWQPGEGTEWSVDIWAPELHYIGGVWYIYTAAAQPGKGNASHRTLVLHSQDPDPMKASAWQFLGPLKGLPDHFHIDATVFSPRPHELYCCYSGWPLGDDSDLEQVLFLVKLASPEQAIPETLRVISKPELPWERADGGRHGINEGPTWVSTPSFQGIVYSANGSWTHEYKLALLQLTGQDLLNPKSWTKRQHPLLISDLKAGPPFGPGHASFVASPYNMNELFCVYHGTGRSDDGWSNRKARVVRLGPEHFHQQGITHRCAHAAPVTGGGGQTPNAHTYSEGMVPQREENPGTASKIIDRITSKIDKFLPRGS